MATQRATAPWAAWLGTAVLSLLLYRCWADGGGPSLAERVIWAVNAGGEAHTDMHGIHFKKDPLEGKLGKGECMTTGDVLVLTSALFKWVILKRNVECMHSGWLPRRNVLPFFEKQIVPWWFPHLIKSQ